MAITISAVVERWPVAGQFIIARGAKTHVDVLVVAASNGSHIGMGEGTAIYYHGESAETCLAQVMAIADQLSHMDAQYARIAAQTLLLPGAARNALDCALWDLEAKAAGVPLWQLAGLSLVVAVWRNDFSGLLSRFSGATPQGGGFGAAA